MPMRLNVGVSKKLGMPEYSSIGATCNIELELEARLLEADLDGFHAQVRSAYVAAQQAVNDELARLQAQPAPPPAVTAGSVPGPGHRNGSRAEASGVPARTGGAAAGPASRPRPARSAPIVAIARAQHADLEGVLRDEYGVERPEDLSLAEASQLIDQLKAAAAI